MGEVWIKCFTPMKIMHLASRAERQSMRWTKFISLASVSLQKFLHWLSCSLVVSTHYLLPMLIGTSYCKTSWHTSNPKLHHFCTTSCSGPYIWRYYMESFFAARCKPFRIFIIPGEPVSDWSAALPLWRQCIWVESGPPAIILGFAPTNTAMHSTKSITYFSEIKPTSRGT